MENLHFTHRNEGSVEAQDWKLSSPNFERLVLFYLLACQHLLPVCQELTRFCHFFRYLATIENKLGYESKLLIEEVVKHGTISISQMIIKVAARCQAGKSLVILSSFLFVL